MAALLFNGLGIILALDAVLIAALASNRVSGDPEALRTGAAFAGVYLAAGLVCLVVARLA